METSEGLNGASAVSSIIHKYIFTRENQTWHTPGVDRLLIIKYLGKIWISVSLTPSKSVPTIASFSFLH